MCNTSYTTAITYTLKFKQTIATAGEYGFSILVSMNSILPCAAALIIEKIYNTRFIYDVKDYILYCDGRIFLNSIVLITKKLFSLTVKITLYSCRPHIKVNKYDTKHEK